MGGWSNLTLVTDAEIGAIEPQATLAAAPWGATTWATARGEAKKQLKVLIELAFPTVVGAADRILDRHQPDYVFTLVSSAYTDVTSEAVNDDEEDLDLNVILATSSDKLYIGAAYQFEGLWVKLKDSVNATARTLTVKYSGPSGWATVSVTDGTAATAGKPFGQSGRITWTIPTDWQQIRLASQTAEEYFWIEVSLSGAPDAGTAASQILPIRAPDGLKRVAALMALHVIFNGLERQAGRPQEWADKAKFYKDEAMALWQLLKENGGIPLDINRDETVSQAEIQETRPVRLGRA